jgi:hypothetical protein
VHVFKAQVDDTEPFVLHARRLYLNDTTHSIVAKAYMHPYLPGIGPSETIGSHTDATITIVVGKEAFKLWKEVLPAMVESCRDWEHRQDCSFNGNGIPIAMGSGEGDSPLCYVLCSMGPRRAHVLLSFLFLELRIWKNYGIAMNLSLFQWPN